MTGLKRALAQTIALSLIMQAFVLGSPYYMQIAVDTALPSLDNNLLSVLALGFGLFAVINTGASLLRSFVLLSAGSSLSYGISSNVVQRLFRLPISWFEKRHVGDILSRFQSVAPIQQALTQGAVGALIDGGLALLTLGLMFFYSASLALVAVVALVLYAATRAISFAVQRDSQQSVIVASAKAQSTLIESVRGIVTLRLFNREAERHRQWQNRLVDSINASIRLSRISIWQGTANSLVFGLESIISIWLAVGFVISGGFSVGMVFAYMAYKGQFLARAASLIDQGIAFRMLSLHLERLSDVALAEQDIGCAQQSMPKQRLKGRIELKDVRFRYSPTDPFVLDGISLTIEQGEHVAIVGPSGGGKSTLIKIILGLLEPTSGEVLVDGVPLNQFGYANYREQVGAVLQEDHLFAGSIADNIALFDDAPDMDRITAAAKAAAIEDDIGRMPMAYETLVGDMGSSLSGGQRQRLLLARGFYRKPHVLVLDEATSHLDVANETHVLNEIARGHITRIISAHRPAAIASTDKLVVVADGRIQTVSAVQDLEAVTAPAASM